MPCPSASRRTTEPRRRSPRRRRSAGTAAPEGVDLLVEWQGVRLQRSFVRTDGTGEFAATFPVPPDEVLGEVPLRVLFAGSSRIEPVEASGRAVVRDAVTLLLDPAVAWRNQTATL